MKRVITSAILLCFAILLTVGENVFIANSCNGLNNSLTKAQNYINSENYELAQQTAKQINLSWETKQKYLSLFVSADSLQQISQSVIRLPTFSTAKYKGLFCSECNQIVFLLDQIKNSESFSLTGIF